ncbi:large conductance mechanosensitive channel protein MscL [Listeria fleischmannii]|uniref:Large-conductance mechanosensitive channel n=2 Tax=Listeria fleischmannii TaxID=1069827 RepID=W7DM94_9LIST|nr:large conductance mechanosensitive channel protein MscL [Listeria fleischmannii]EIA20076.1 large-conductance mechanosensitive channel [Listeria fleischmannii subsp. coloradonensis]EUJ53466.1 large-conductance mechanosensitive channel [Listeria fleischmannii FSL S10-1203]STY35999.1 Large-conductance mechanosensitive channel [Listeria fleischmannii subsp. coloradonensis]
MKNFMQEFKDFALKGNVLDLAIGVVIGAAFGKIVSSLVDNIIMPLVGMILGGVSFSDLHVVVGSADLKYGLFIQSVVDFVIIALSLFVFIKVLIGLTKRRKEEEEAAPEEVNKSEEYLKEIRDLLQAKKVD